MIQPAPTGAPPAGPPQHEQLAGQLLDHAVQAEHHVEQLATGLAQAGTDPEAVHAVSQCAALLRRIAHGLGRAHAGATPEQAAPPATMGGATDHLTSQLAANRGGPPQ